jgi:hypothetical protein
LRPGPVSTVLRERCIFARNYKIFDFKYIIYIRTRTLDTHTQTHIAGIWRVNLQLNPTVVVVIVVVVVVVLVVVVVIVEIEEE